GRACVFRLDFWEPFFDVDFTIKRPARPRTTIRRDNPWVERTPRFYSAAWNAFTTTRAKRRSRKRNSRNFVISAWLLPTGERPTVILSKDGIKSAIQLTPS